MENTTPIQDKLVKKTLGQIIGPGLVTGAADDDPSGIATYSQAGAATGFGLLWLALFTLPLMVVIQEMSARIALVTGRGLASNIKSHFSRKILIFITLLLVIANTFNIGADLSIMASVVNSILPSIPPWFALIFIALATAMLEIFVSYKKYSSFLKWLTLALLSYIATAFLVHQNFKDLLVGTFFPSLKIIKEHIFIIVAVLGTTISPYLFFWQASEEIEDEIGDGDDTIEKRMLDGQKEISGMRKNVWAGMFFSNLVMFFIIAVCGQTLFKNGVTDIKSAGEAALSLKPLAGQFAFLLFSIGIIGTGLLALPVLAGSSAYAISEAFDFDEGLYRKYKDAKAFYAVIFISILAGLLISFIGIDPIVSLIYSAVLNGLVAPFIILIILLIAKNSEIMGNFKNGFLSNTLGWLLFGLMSAAGIATIIQFF